MVRIMNQPKTTYKVEHIDMFGAWSTLDSVLPLTTFHRARGFMEAMEISAQVNGMEKPKLRIVEVVTQETIIETNFEED